MYYIENKEFNQTCLYVYKRLFSGFSFPKNIIFPQNKKEEHFAFHYITAEKPKDKKIKKSSIYKMSKKERISLIKESFAKVLGFKSYENYKIKIKNPVGLIDLNNAPYRYLSKLEKNLAKELKSHFNFEEEPFFHLGTYWEVRNNKTKKFREQNFSTEEDFKDTYEYYLNMSIFSNPDKSKEEIVSRLNKSLNLHEEPELYELGNYMCFFNQEKNPIFSFLEDIDYLYNIFKVEENIKNLSFQNYQEFIKDIKICFKPDTLIAIQLIRENKTNYYIDFLKKLHKTIDKE